ncbi:MAG: ABC transporter permease subunit [Candidatus Sumerlaeota bacterium]|nr:ABC transporter permease subunit [Candidatus Sumerlaeota bacterium]
MIFWALLKFEWKKTMRMRTTYIAFLAAALLVVIIEFGLFLIGSRSPLAKSFRAFDFNLSWIINGYTATQISMLVAFIILIAPMTIMTFARQVAGENQSGTLRLILSRPISRFALLNAKFIVCMTYSALLMGFFFVFSYGLGTMLFGWTESVSVPDRRDLNFGRLSPEYSSLNAKSGGSGRRGGGWAPPGFDYRKTADALAMRNQIEAELRKLLISPWQCLRRLALAWVLTSWALFTLGALALVYSTLNRYPIAAMALTLATFFLVFILQQLATLESLLIPMFTSIEPYLFTKAMGYWSACFKSAIDWKEIVHGLWLLGAYTLAFFALAQFLFRRRDITS